MTVASLTNKSGPYNGNGSTSAFAVNTKYTAKSEVAVIVTSAAGVETTKTLDTHYTLTDPGDSGTVTFITSPTDFRPQTGETVTIITALALTQATDLTSGGGLTTGVLEGAYDKLTRLVQQIAEKVSRAPKLRQTTTTGELTLPEPDAAKLLGWNAAGTALENKAAADLDLTVVSAFIATLLDDANAVETRDTLGVEIGADVQAWDADLDAIAALATTAYGRSLLTLADDDALAAEISEFYQPLDADLTAIAALTTTAFGRSVLGTANAAALLSLAGGAPATVGQGKHTIWVPAGSMVARGTNPPSVISGFEHTTNDVMEVTLGFDATTAEFAQFHIWMPKSWNESTVTARFLWHHPATVTNFGVAWRISGRAYGDGDAIDAAQGTAITTTDIGGSTNTFYLTAETNAITIGGTPVEGDLVIFQVSRDPSNGADTLGVDANLWGVQLFFTTNAATDD